MVHIIIMNNKKQTAIEWLIEELLIYGDKAFNKEISLGEYHIKKNELINEAKAIEKQQMCDFFREGYMWCNSPSLRIQNGEIVTSTIKYGEFYYNETFNLK